MIQVQSHGIDVGSGTRIIRFTIMLWFTIGMRHAVQSDFAEAASADFFKRIPVSHDVIMINMNQLFEYGFGLGQISTNTVVSRLSWFATQLFRNSPWLVLLFIVMLAFPFEIEIGDTIYPIPDWMKAVFGLALPIMANISEIVRGGIMSVSTGQWEAAESLAFSRRQTLWQIILPQCFKRMIPPWMNWYAILNPI